MKTNALPDDIDSLLVLRERLATVSGERPAKPGSAPSAEAELLANIAAVQFTNRAYRAMLDGAEESPIAKRFVVPARIARNRAIRRLRRRLVRAIAELSEFLNTGDLMNVAAYAGGLSRDA